MSDSVQDTRMAAFVARAFLFGSLADRSTELLISKGAPANLALAGKQIFLGQSPDPRGHVDPNLYP